jgi:hypothetical protein
MSNVCSVFPGLEPALSAWACTLQRILTVFSDIVRSRFVHGSTLFIGQREREGEREREREIKRGRERERESESERGRRRVRKRERERESEKEGERERERGRTWLLN